MINFTVGRQKTLRESYQFRALCSSTWCSRNHKSLLVVSFPSSFYHLYDYTRRIKFSLSYLQRFYLLLSGAFKNSMKILGFGSFSIPVSQNSSSKKAKSCRQQSPSRDLSGDFLDTHMRKRNPLNLAELQYLCQCTVSDCLVIFFYLSENFYLFFKLGLLHEISWFFIVSFSFFFFIYLFMKEKIRRQESVHAWN